MDLEQCPAIAPLFGFLGVAFACILASKLSVILCCLDEKKSGVGSQTTTLARTNNENGSMMMMMMMILPKQQYVDVHGSILLANQSFGLTEQIDSFQSSMHGH